MIVNIFSKQNDDKPFILKVDNYLKKHFIICTASFRASDLSAVSNFVTWRVTLISNSSNTQHFEYCQNVSLLPNYNHSNVLTIEQQANQKELIKMATHWGLSIRKFAHPTNEVVRLPLPSSAHIIDDILIKASALYCENFQDWADKKQLNASNILNYDIYRDNIAAAVRFNSLFSFKEQCELSDILNDF